MITFGELLKARNFNFSEKTLLVRHSKTGTNMFELIEKGYLEMFQSSQKDEAFKKCKYMIVFIGLESKKALFYNIYEITGTQDIQTINFPKDFPVPEFKENNYDFYNLKPLAAFEDLRNE
jgi:hypothetical protein